MDMASSAATTAVFLPFITGLLAHCIAARGATRQHVARGACIASAAASLILLCIAFLHASASSFSYTLVATTLNGVELSFGFHVDVLALIPAILCALFCLLALIYNTRYMSSGNRYYGNSVSTRFNTSYSFMLFFSGGMTGALLSRELLTLAIFWEIVSLCSYVLIGFRITDARSSSAALKCFVMTHVGSVAFFIALVIVHVSTGTTVITDAGALIPAGAPVVPVLLVIFLVSAMPKAVQYPLHSWLPDGTIAPTSATVLFHVCGFQVGLYVMVRLFSQAFLPHVRVMGLPSGFVLFGESMTVVGLVIAIIGGVTLVIASLFAMIESNIKRIIAYQTISELGLVVMMIGVNSPLSLAAGLFQLVSHAFIAGLLFLCAGSILHATGRGDLAGLNGLHRSMPATAACFLTCTLAVSCIPLLSEFAGKVLMVHALIESRAFVFLVLVVLGNVLHVGISFRFFFSTFMGSSREPASPGKDPPAAMLVPMLVMAGAIVVLGILPATFLNVAIVPALGQIGFVESTMELAHGIQTRVGFLDTIALLAFVVLVILAFLAIARVVRGKPSKQPRTGDTNAFSCGDDAGAAHGPLHGDLYHVFSRSLDLQRWCTLLDVDRWYARVARGLRVASSRSIQAIDRPGAIDFPLKTYFVMVLLVAAIFLLAGWI